MEKGFNEKRIKKSPFLNSELSPARFKRKKGENSTGQNIKLYLIRNNMLICNWIGQTYGGDQPVNGQCVTKA